jgi:predicted lipoprotein with Yx(FWY)xxD motif
MRFLVVVLLALVLVPATMADRSSAPTLKAGSSFFGKVLFDGRGFVVYAFTRDHGPRSACYGACAKAWPPYVAPKGTLSAGAGVKRALLGTAKRTNGRRQVTYAGRPLYYYVGDTKPKQILCQDVVEYGGRWLIVRPSGKLVR